MFLQMQWLAAYGTGRPAALRGHAREPPNDQPKARRTRFTLLTNLGAASRTTGVVEEKQFEALDEKEMLDNRGRDLEYAGNVS